ncbi:MAG: hypothetical protein U9P12_06115 [Verrucomicrobiota bacterium]|nr:hypothetical protein [Verrucomicrobiota bacterium]
MNDATFSSLDVFSGGTTSVSSLGRNGARPSTAVPDAQALSRRFNEDEAVWRCFEALRARRRWRRRKTPLSEEALERLDWAEAERTCRETRCIGEWMP